MCTNIGKSTNIEVVDNMLPWLKSSVANQTITRDPPAHNLFTQNIKYVHSPHALHICTTFYFWFLFWCNIPITFKSMKVLILWNFHLNDLKVLSIDVSILIKSCHFSEPTRKAGSNLNRFKIKSWSLKMLALYQQNRGNIGTSSCIPFQSYFLPPLEFSPTPIWECRTSEGQQVTQWIRNVVAPRLSLKSLFPESPPFLSQYWPDWATTGQKETFWRIFFLRAVLFSNLSKL